MCIEVISRKAGIVKVSKNLIVGMTFPKQDITLGLEPSVLTVLPDGDNVRYSMANGDEFNDNDVMYYVCSVYITGMREFFEWSKRHDKSKIIVGGYEPTINPGDFTEYASRVMIGPCDDFYASLAQEGQVIHGITNYKKIPRYDLYDVRNNQQIIPDKLKDDICTSINTSQGCPFKCDFCCSPLMCDHIISKPLDAVRKEVEYLKQHNAKYIFIRDENFPLQSDWKEKLQIINTLSAKIYLFASANLCTEDTVRFMKENGVYMICLGLEDITVDYRKNDRLVEVCNRLHRYGIFVYLSFIINPLKVNTEKSSTQFYNRLLERVHELKPEMVCGNFLMPFRGTKIWDDYKDIVTEEDFSEYDSKSAFLEKDKVIRAEIEYRMFEFQHNYYHSEFYSKNCREFRDDDTLGLRFKELEDTFRQHRKIW